MKEIRKLIQDATEKVGNIEEAVYNTNDKVGEKQSEIWSKKGQKCWK